MGGPDPDKDPGSLRAPGDSAPPGPESPALCWVPSHTLVQTWKVQEHFEGASRQQRSWGGGGLEVFSFLGTSTRSLGPFEASFLNAALARRPQV